MKKQGLAILLLLAPMAALSLNAQDFVLGKARTLPEPQPKPPIYDYSPDGHYTVFRTGDSLMMFWPGHDSYRTTGASIFEMRGCAKVLPMGAPNGFNNGGAWLYSVFQRADRRMLGFYHAEDHKFPLDPDSKWIAYKSIARCTSEDLGLMWSHRARRHGARSIPNITQRPRPEDWFTLVQRFRARCHGCA